VAAATGGTEIAFGVLVAVLQGQGQEGAKRGAKRGVCAGSARGMVLDLATDEGSGELG
jgi:hypothetical protein